MRICNDCSDYATWPTFVPCQLEVVRVIVSIGTALLTKSPVRIVILVVPNLCQLVCLGLGGEILIDSWLGECDNSTCDFYGIVNHLDDLCPKCGAYVWPESMPIPEGTLVIWREDEG